MAGQPRMGYGKEIEVDLSCVQELRADLLILERLEAQATDHTFKVVRLSSPRPSRE